MCGCLQLSSIGLFGSGKDGLRQRKSAAAAPRLLSRLEQLRLLSKAEQAGLLSLAERNGLTLTLIEESGLLSKAESLGLLSAATDRCALAVRACRGCRAAILRAAAALQEHSWKAVCAGGAARPGCACCSLLHA